MKKTIYFFVGVFGTLGGFAGGVIDHGNDLGGWSILLGAAGSLFGIWVGYKYSQWNG